MSLSYSDRLDQIQQALNTRVCVGLDPDPDRIPEFLIERFGITGGVSYFVEAIIEATLPYAAAYKLNFAFFEALGADGLRILDTVRRRIPEGRIAIADAKRGDIGNTARFYARSVFDDMDFDAITISPYMGSDSVIPFLSYEGKGAYVLIRTSNSGAAAVQLVRSATGEPLYQVMARSSSEWSSDFPGALGFVMGASDLDALSTIRDTYSNVPLLIPGIGAQGGDADAVSTILATGTGPVLINSSRSILYASSADDFAEAAAIASREMRDRLRS